MLSVSLLAHLQILWTLLTYLRLLHSHHSLKFWTILAYVEHCHRLSSTDTTWLLQSVLHIMSSFIFTKCVSIISVHRPQTFQELLNALTQIKMQSFYLPSVSHTLLCLSPALSWFSGDMIFLLMPWVYATLTNYSKFFAQEMPSTWNSFYPIPTPTFHLVNSYWPFSFQFTRHVSCHVLSTPCILYMVSYFINVSLS